MPYSLCGAIHSKGAINSKGAILSLEFLAEYGPLDLLFKFPVKKNGFSLTGIISCQFYIIILFLSLSLSIINAILDEIFSTSGRSLTNYN